MKNHRAVSTDILHFRARILGVYGQGLFHGQPLTPETVSAVHSSDPENGQRLAGYARHPVAIIVTAVLAQMAAIRGS